MGSIIDTRSSVGKPSLLHFLAMSSEDLLKLLLQAYDKQMEVLIEHEVRERAKSFFMVLLNLILTTACIDNDTN